MINAHVFKNANKKFAIRDTVIIQNAEQAVLQLPQMPGLIPEEADVENLEDMIQQSGNVVINIQDITLKEATIPDFQLPPNDGFGEENPNQTLQPLLDDRTVEMMLNQPETSVAHHSGLEPPHDQSLDQTRS